MITIPADIEALRSELGDQFDSLVRMLKARKLLQVPTTDNDRENRKRAITQAKATASKGSQPSRADLLSALRAKTKERSSDDHVKSPNFYAEFWDKAKKAVDGLKSNSLAYSGPMFRRQPIENLKELIDEYINKVPKLGEHSDLLDIPEIRKYIRETYPVLYKPKKEYEDDKPKPEPTPEPLKSQKSQQAAAEVATAVSAGADDVAAKAAQQQMEQAALIAFWKEVSSEGILDKIKTLKTNPLTNTSKMYQRQLQTQIDKLKEIVDKYFTQTPSLKNEAKLREIPEISAYLDTK